MTPPNGCPRLFVTVGSTKFVDLVEEVLSPPVLDAVSQAAQEMVGKGNASIVIQFGATPMQDIIFGGPLFHKGKGDDDEGTLPITLLGGKRPTVETDASEIADSLRPEAIKRDLAQADSHDEDQLGFKHFTMEKKASHGTIQLELIDYVKSIGPYLKAADVVVSHAGSGTILETLRMETSSRPKLIVVPNETLMDNHQMELARALSEKHYVYSARLRTNKAILGDKTE